jgi:hypothetical protein
MVARVKRGGSSVQALLWFARRRGDAESLALTEAQRHKGQGATSNIILANAGFSVPPVVALKEGRAPLSRGDEEMETLCLCASVPL